MNTLKNVVLLIFSLIITTSFSQNKQIKEALHFYDNNEYADAIKKYESLVKKGLKNSEVYKNLGNAYYFNADLKNSVKPYAKLIALNENIESEYYFRYAHALKSIENYVEADKMMRRFKEEKNNDNRTKLFEKMPNYLEEINNQSGRYTINNLSFNSKNSDFGPSFYNNGIIFSSSRSGGKEHAWNNKPFLNLFNAKEPNRSFSKKINTKYHESTPVFTKDGKTIYFTRNNYFKNKYRKDYRGVNNLKIFRATKDKTGNWVDLTELPFNSDQYSVAHPALSPDEKTLYFASDMPGTRGESDIYKVSINYDGSFGKPINMGGIINTEARETFPFVSKDNMLYFASDGHLGLGGLDIFVTNLSNLKNVTNLGKPINGSTDDFSFIIDDDTKIGYFASNRKGGKGSDDIYSFKELITIKNYNIVKTKNVDSSKKIAKNEKSVLNF